MLKKLCLDYKRDKEFKKKKNDLIRDRIQYVT